MSVIDYVNPAEVNDAESFARYAEQTLGMHINKKELAILKKGIKVFFERYPQANYYTLCRLCGWAKERKRRPATASTLINMYRYAWSDGALPELDPSERKDPEIEQAIEKAMKVADPDWQLRMIRARGVAARRRVYETWLKLQ